MKTIKPLALSLLHRVIEQGGALNLCVAGVACVTLDDDAKLLSELALWKDVAPLLGGTVDEVALKRYGEVFKGDTRWQAMGRDPPPRR